MYLQALALSAALAPLVTAHYTLPDFINQGVVSQDWQYVRMTANYQSQGPVTDVTSDAIRCYELNSTTSTTTNAAAVATVTAGSNVGFQADNTFYHPGYFSAYMSVASPSADSESAGLGSTWFKIWEWAPTYDASTNELTMPPTTINQINFTIPAAVPSGQYLLRGEQIALHVASTEGGAQFYLSCAQINVVNGGSGTPSPTVSFPGAYSATDPGILINIYDLPAGFTGYQAPGPAVWSG